MNIRITGHARGLGRSLYEHFKSLGAKEVISKYRPTVVTDENDHLIVKILNNLKFMSKT